MVTIDIPVLDKKDTFMGDSNNSVFVLTNNNPTDIHVYVSGIYLTETEDYTTSDNEVTFVEAPLQDENINILYKV